MSDEQGPSNRDNDKSYDFRKRGKINYKETDLRKRTLNKTLTSEQNESGYFSNASRYTYELTDDESDLEKSRLSEDGQEDYFWDNSGTNSTFEKNPNQEKTNKEDNDTEDIVHDEEILDTEDTIYNEETLDTEDTINNEETHNVEDQQRNEDNSGKIENHEEHSNNESEIERNGHSDEEDRDNSDIERESDQGGLPEQATMAAAENLAAAQRISAQQSALRDITLGIDKYDGASGLSSFIAECKRAKEELGENNWEAELCKMIVKTKLAKNVRSKIQIPDTGYPNLVAMFKDLKQIKRGAKTELQLTGEIGLMYQEDGETIRDFGKRIQEAGVLVNDVHVLTAGETPEQWKARLDEILQRSFKLGVKPEIGRMLTTGASLKDDIMKAAEMEEQEEQRTRLRQMTSISRPAKQVNMVKIEDNGNNSNARKFCNYCKKKNHEESECFKKINENNPSKRGAECYACGNKGHIARSCPYREQLNKKNQVVSQNSQTICQLCDKKNHTAAKCYKYLKNNNNPARCAYCKNLGHTINECRKRKAANSNQGNGQHTSQSGNRGGYMNQQSTSNQRVNAVINSSEDEE